MFERSSTSKPRLAALASIAGGLAGGVATVVRRRRAAGSATGPATAPDGGPVPQAGADGPTQWSCECGQEYRVSGEGRHRVYWLKDADPSDPVIGGRCPECDRPLPGEHVIDDAASDDDGDDDEKAGDGAKAKTTAEGADRSADEKQETA